MSLILEALNRADKDRSSEQNSPPIQGQAYVNDTPPSQNKSYRFTTIALIIALIIVATAVVTYIFSHTNTKASIDTATTTNINEHSSSANTKEKSQVSVTTVQSEQFAATQPPEHPPQAIEKVSTSISTLYNQQKVRESSQQTNLRQTIEVASSENKAIEKLPPLVSDLPWTIQKQIPTIDYNQHVYLDAGNSFVEINDKIIKNGQIIQSGLKLINIEEEHAILSYQQNKFRLPALNSWVNFN
ncbi:MAG: flagellar basal body-associated protein FliL [Pseudohongiellaceae bacterium]|jgi:flagellar basal body-associated protein FliL